jgi:hypothetical protein
VIERSIHSQRMFNTPTLRRPGLAVLLALLFASVMTYYHLGIFLPRAIELRAARDLGGGYSFGDDFYPIWLTSRNALHGERNLYGQATTREIQIGLFGRPVDGRNRLDPPSDYRTFAYPAYVDLLFWPLGLLSFPAVRILMAVLLALVTAASIPLWLAAFRLKVDGAMLAVFLALTLSSYPSLEGLFADQPGLLVGFLLAACFAALARNRLILAGSLFAFTLIKPHVALIIGAYLLLWTFSQWRERQRFFWGLLAWSLALAGLSLVVWPHWIGQWLHVLSGYGGYAPPPLITYSLGARIGPRVGPILLVALLLAALILMWRMRRVEAGSLQFSLTASLLLAITSIALLPGQAVYDHVILLPGILLTLWMWRRTAASNRAFAFVLGCAALAVFWQWIATPPFLLVGLFLKPPMSYLNNTLMFPFHAAASVPLAVTAVLGYLMRDAMRDRSTALEE